MKPPVRIRWDSDHRAYVLRVAIGPLNFAIHAPWKNNPPTRKTLPPKLKEQ